MSIRRCFGDTSFLQWGRHALRIFHNPGKTMCSLNIDVPSCDLIFAGDNIVGNIVYLSRSSPEMIDQAIGRLQLLHRAQVIGGHMGVFTAPALAHARYYLRRLREIVVEIRHTHSHERAAHAIQSVSIESCLTPDVIPTEFEREWHGRNLDVIVEQSTFELDAIQLKLATLEFLRRKVTVAPGHDSVIS